MDEKIVKRKGTKINIEAKKKLKEIYAPLGITRCEIGLPICSRTWPLAFAHRHRRWWYIRKPELLSSYNQTIISCQMCHNEIDSNQELLEEVFSKLRGNENV